MFEGSRGNNIQRRYGQKDNRKILGNPVTKNEHGSEGCVSQVVKKRRNRCS
jgi:hypothetical protein